VVKLAKHVNATLPSGLQPRTVPSLSLAGNLSAASYPERTPLIANLCGVLKATRRV
jgi:hypothetical protein